MLNSGLLQDIARSRAERASRLTDRTSDDPRDTASARQNILNLVSAGQQSLTSSSSGSTPSLAQFMGGGAQRRTHKVGTGMTDAEREETEKLEKEMAATRAKWAAKNGGAVNSNEAEGPAGKGMSLASLMMGKPAGAKESPVAAKVAQRWQPQSSAESSNPNSTDEDRVTPLVEAKVVSRSPPAPSSANAKHASTPSQAPSTASAPSSASEFGARPLPPSSTAASSSTAANSSTLTRLQSSNIVADRLKWSQSLQQPEESATSPKMPASPEKKRGSVTERWRRDEPAEGASKPSLARQKQEMKGGGDAEENQPEERPTDAEIAVAEADKVEEENLPATPVTENVTPKLVHVRTACSQLISCPKLRG